MGGRGFIWRRLVMIEIKNREHELIAAVQAAHANIEQRAGGGAPAGGRPPIALVRGPPPSSPGPLGRGERDGSDRSDHTTSDRDHTRGVRAGRALGADCARARPSPQGRAGTQAAPAARRELIGARLAIPARTATSRVSTCGHKAQTSTRTSVRRLPTDVRAQAPRCRRCAPRGEEMRPEEWCKPSSFPVR